jgi:hypothetical protein
LWRCDDVEREVTSSCTFDETVQGSDVLLEAWVIATYKRMSWTKFFEEAHDADPDITLYDVEQSVEQAIDG